MFFFLILQMFSGGSGDEGSGDEADTSIIEDQFIGDPVTRFLLAEGAEIDAMVSYCLAV